MKPKTIFHAHNWNIKSVLNELPRLSERGFDAVQLSPLQLSPPGQAWFLRYQPIDHTVISGLGDRNELTELCATAAQLGLLVIADVVFNHMAVPVSFRRQDWLRASQLAEAGDHSVMHRMRQCLNSYPNLSESDFQPWRDMTGADWDNEHRYESWGNGEWPELKPTSNVIARHIEHLQILYDCGVRGFRFDAVKHMRDSHLRHYVDFIGTLPESCWCYGEVFSTDVAMHSEYRSLFPTTDFVFIEILRKLFTKGAPFELNAVDCFLDRDSVRFATNHDLEFNPKDLVQGLLFASSEQTIIATCICLLAEGGSVLILATDDQPNPLVLQCVALRKSTGGFTGQLNLQFKAGCWELKFKSQSFALDIKSQQLKVQ